MRKLETIIYIVGPKRSWEFQAKHVKQIIWVLLLVFLGLGGTIAYQQYEHLTSIREADDKLDQETLKNEKLLALLAKIKEEGMGDNPSGTTTDIDLSKQQKLSQQQSILIEQQRKELKELKGVLNQRERVVQQFQLEKQSTKDQVITLQEQLRKTREDLQQTSSEKETALLEIQESQAKLAEANKLMEQQRQKSKKTRKAIKSNQTVSLTNESMIGISNLKMNSSGSKMKVTFRINNLTNQLQRGRVGIYLSPKGEDRKTIAYASGKTQSYAIRRLKNINNELSGYRKGQQIRVVIWNQDKKLILDEIFNVPN